MRTLLFAGLLVLVIGSCAAAPRLDLQLENATDPVMQVFEDESIAIRFTLGREHLAFDLRNKTNGVLRIHWDDILFEDAEGNRHSVVHSGADYARLNAPQEPTAVTPGSRIQERCIPKSHITESEADPGEWEIQHLLIPRGATEAETRKLASEVVGKNITVLMPLEVGGQREYYQFEFKITAVTGPTGRGTEPKRIERETIDVVK